MDQAMHADQRAHHKTRSAKDRTQASVNLIDEIDAEIMAHHAPPSGPKIVFEPGQMVRHTRFLNTNTPGGIRVVEVEAQRALCEYVDSTSRTRQTWFILRDLIKVKG